MKLALVRGFSCKHPLSRVKQQQGNVQKKLLHVQICFFANYRSIVVVFTVLVAFNLSLVLLNFIFSLRNL